MSVHVGAVIRKLRARPETRFTQAELADAVKIRQQTLYRIEKGGIQNPKTPTLRRIAAALRTTVEALLDEAAVQAPTMEHTNRRVNGE
jgi:DNA-binding XRE family transcriptional regulator